MRAASFLLALALLLAIHASPAAAVDPRDVDILGFRLGMALPDAVRRLTPQVADPSRIRSQTGPCGGASTAACTLGLTAPTHDGSLLIRFRPRAGPGSEAIWSIAYTLAGRGAGEPEMIRAAVLDRFGPPTSSDPPTWCATGDSAGCQPPDQPRLTFTEGPETSSTLTLSDPAVPQGGP